MFDLGLSWAVVVLPFLFAIGVELYPKEHRDSRLWRWGIIGFGLLLSVLTFVQMQRAAKNAKNDREGAIVETSTRVSGTVSESVSKSVTKAVSEQYEQTIRDLHGQISTLQSELSKQGKKVDVIGASNIVTGKSPVKVEIMNPASVPSGPVGERPLPNLSWTQKPGELKNGKATAEVDFKVDDLLDFPAFVAVCDRPCTAVEGLAPPMSQAIPLRSSSPNVAGILFNMPRPLSTASSCVLNLVSQDAQPITVRAFRILRRSELPPELK